MIPLAVRPGAASPTNAVRSQGLPPLVEVQDLARGAGDPVSGVRVGLVGCGRIARLVHLDALQRCSQLELVAAADPVEEHRRAVGARIPTVRLVADHRELLELSDVEAVLLCLPTDRHAEAACDAFAADKHVYLEKPLATNLEDGRRVLDRWRRSGRVGMIGFNYRCDPQYAELGRQLAAGRVGELLAIRTSFTSARRALPDWKKERARGGGVLLDLASHHIDLMRFLVGQEIRNVSARIASLHSEDDRANLVLELEGGLTVQSFFAMGSVDQDRIEVHGRAGRLMVDRLGPEGPRFTSGQHREGRLARLAHELRAVPRRLLQALRSGRESSFDTALESFARAVGSGQSVAPDLEDGLRSLEVVAAAEESARTDRVVAIE